MGFLVLGLVAGIGFASYALWSQLKADEQPEDPDALPSPPAKKALPPSSDRTPMTLQVNDVVQYLGTDYLVEGALTLSEDGQGSRLYRMTDGSRETYLYATPSPTHPLLLERASGDFPEGEMESVVHEGQSYRLKSRVMASAMRVGSMGERGPASTGSSDRVRVLVYGGAAGARLLVLNTSGTVSLYAGKEILPHTLDILPSR